MKTRLLSAKDAPSRSDLLVGFALDGVRTKLSTAAEAEVKKAKATGDLATGFRKVRVFHPAAGSAKRIAFVGLGKKAELTVDRLRRGAALAQERAEALGVTEFQLWVNDTDHHGIDADVAGMAIAEGLVLGAYKYEPKRKEKPKARKGQKAAIVYAGKDSKAFGDGMKLGVANSEGAICARDLGNKPGNEATPTYLANTAKKLAGPSIKVKILEKRDMERLKMGALLGVARGSVQPPKLIVMDHNPAGAKQTLCVVGKGLTFDTGGISIKPSGKMDEMRYDMCGGAAVIGLFQAIKSGALRGYKGKTRVVGIVAASENMPDADAQKPGDVVTACDGTTIEVLNTDAEGRLILSDALAYAVKTFKPDAMVDLATLTGAVIVALGHEVTGIMGNDDGVIEKLVDAGQEVDEPCWELPLWDVHREQMKSRFADLQNINSPAHGNGSIAGGAFLSYFVGDTPWAHMDIAGTAWGQRARDYYRWGASGTAVRTLVRWVRSY